MDPINSSKILSKIPQFLVQKKAESEVISGSTEPLEFIKPNTINVAMSLLEKINSELGDLSDFNNWTDYGAYISEFKLDEIFSDAEQGFYDVSNPELLKGFFQFKGTNIDLQYLLKVAGYSLVIYDPAYYRQALSMYDLLLNRPGNFGSEIQLILDAFTPEEIEEGFAKLTPFLLDNVNPIVLNPDNPIYVINVLVSIEDFLATKSVVLSPSALTYVESLYLIYLDSFHQEFSEIDCNLSAELFVDLDSPSYTGFKANQFKRKLRAVLRTRISPCAYLRDIQVFLETKDYYSVPIQVTEDFSISQNLEIVEQNLNPDEYTSYVISLEIAEEFGFLDLDGKKIMTNIRHDDIYKVDNLDPYFIKGNNNNPWLEETLESVKVLDIPAIKHWTPVDDGFGNVNPTSYPSNRRLLPFDVQGLVGSLNTSEGPVSNGSIVYFKADGTIDRIETLTTWVPVDDGFGDVNPSSYPLDRKNKFFRVSLVSPLNSVIGVISDNDTVYFDHSRALTLIKLV